ncbi:hypothetical protein DFJ74DRAFT_660169 [Hyaloraphidium curvatum]|nr:hypothetical protein DFJ74DRAFT_660169 [Hyaloraphidium curvatum]
MPAPAADAPFPAPLRGARVLVLGGTSGIGFAVASGCLSAGALVHIASSRPEKVAAAVGRLLVVYPAAPVSGSACDLSDLETHDAQLAAVLDAAVAATGGPLDHAVFTSGDALKHVPLADLTPADAIARGTVRFFGAISLAKAVSKGLGTTFTKSPASSIVLTGGTNSSKPSKGWFLAAAFGAGTEGLVRGLAVDLAPVRVNMVEVGAVPTELWGDLPPQTADAMRKQMLVGELGTPESVAEAFLYAMKDRFATGAVVRTDGGRLLV